MSHRKRKHRQRSDTHNSQYDQSEGPSLVRPDPALFIVAHEVDIIRGPQAARTADSLEVFTNVDGNGGSRIGEGLLKWEGNVRGEHGDMWVDRYDARLLLDALPTVSVSAVPPHAPPDSPGGGWSDLPSDSEDTFFLTPDETADLHRTKRMRHLDALRTARMRALSPCPDDDDDADPWGGSDEETRHRRSSCVGRRHTVARATNDAQLRARILAHHGADARFAFLRGALGPCILAEREAQGAGAGALGGLTGYGSGSESEGEPSGGGGDGGGGSDDGVRLVVAQAAQQPETEEPAAGATQEARRAKAREWAQKRRAERAARADDQQRTETSSNLRPSQEPLFSE
ncbi:hypothetical protein EDB86DRAFT_3063812 [Lactarius hatsudake]|nr:hypothetical protein EDB86DRAFT_3063812 [Lactarius hatsudake]